MFLVIVITLFILALFVLGRRDAQRAQLRDSLYLDPDALLRLRVSVVVDGAKSVGYISSLLKSESNAYQLVIVADFSHREPLLMSTIQYFSLFRATLTTPEHLPPDAIVGLYRSHRQLYSRVLVVDSPASKLYSPFEVGAAVSQYDYLLLLSSPKLLRTSALDNILLELSLRPEGSVDEIRSRIGEPIRLVRREAALRRSSSTNTKRQQRIVKIDYKILS